jgi:TetR/AcrR family transcriptional regulator, ethionamide resistance regulator
VPRLSRRTKATEDRRAAVEQRVLDAAEGLLEDGHAYADLSIERIASQAGISRTAFYDYFRDKRELLIRLLERIVEPLYGRADEFISSRSGPESLREILAYFMGFSREHHVLFRAAHEASSYDEAIYEFSGDVLGSFVEPLQGRIEAEQSAGQALPMPAHATAFTLVWMTWHVCYEWLAGETQIEEDDLLEALTLVWQRSIYGPTDS